VNRNGAIVVERQHPAGDCSRTDHRRCPEREPERQRGYYTEWGRHSRQAANTEEGERSRRGTHRQKLEPFAAVIAVMTVIDGGIDHPEQAEGQLRDEDPAA
jgi:hypothetical protein